MRATTTVVSLLLYHHQSSASKLLFIGRYFARLQPLLLASYILRTSRKGAKLKPSYTSAPASQSRGGTEPPGRGRSYGHRGGHHAPRNEALRFESMPLFDLIRPLGRLRARSICFRGKTVGARHGAERIPGTKRRSAGVKEGLFEKLNKKRGVRRPTPFFCIAWHGLGGLASFYF